MPFTDVYIQTSYEPRNALHFSIAHPRKEGNSLSRFVHSNFGTQQLECWNLGVYYQKTLRNLLDRVESMYTSMSLLCISLKKASIWQLPDMSRRQFLTM